MRWSQAAAEKAEREIAADRARQLEQRVMSREHSTPLLAVYNGRTCCGILLKRGRDGVEAFDSDERSLGLFPTEQEAAAALEAEAAA